MLASDPRLRGNGRAELVNLLTEAFPSRSEINVLIDNSGLSGIGVPDPSDGKIRNLWSTLLASLEETTEPSLNALLAAVMFEFETKGSRLAPYLKSWLDRGKRQDALSEAVAELLSQGKFIENAQEVRTLTDNLVAIRGVCLDIVEFLEAGTADGSLNAALSSGSLVKERDELISVIVNLRLSVDRLHSSLSRIDNNLGRGLISKDQLFIQDDVIDGVLMVNRGFVEENIRLVRRVIVNKLTFFTQIQI